MVEAVGEAYSLNPLEIEDYFTLEQIKLMYYMQGKRERSRLQLQAQLQIALFSKKK